MRLCEGEGECPPIDFLRVHRSRCYHDLGVLLPLCPEMGIPLSTERSTKDLGQPQRTRTVGRYDPDCPEQTEDLSQSRTGKLF